MTIIHTDDDYRLTRDGHLTHGDNLVWIEHYCVHYTSLAQNKWRTFTCNLESRGFPCDECKRRPSDGLQGAFWFLKTETT